MWIKLHFYGSEDEVWVQTQNICAVYRDQRSEFEGATVIDFIGSNDFYTLVKETPDEIGVMITE